MTRIVSFLTVLLFLGIAGNALAQREVPPPAKTPFDAQPSVTQTKAAVKPVQSVKATDKAKTNAKPAPVQTAKTPTATESKTVTAENQPEKAKKTAQTVAAKSSAKNQKRVANHNQKDSKVCKTAAKKDNRQAAQAKKDSVKSAKKTDQKQVIRATTIPLE